MDDTLKMLQTIINGQSALKGELSKKITVVQQQVAQLDSKVTQLDQKIDKVEQELNERLDKIGLQLAYLEDDAPTREEHEQLEARVTKLEHHAPSR